MNTLRTMLLILLVAIVSAVLGFWFAHRHAVPLDQSKLETTVPMPSAKEKKVLYWYDPMVPNQHFDKPGKSPFMDMDLVPKYADVADTARVKIDPGVQQNLALRRTVVERRALSQAVETVGSLTFNERNIAIVQTRSNGFVERVYALAPGDVVKENQPLADLLIPEWAGAQLEYLALRRNGTPELLEAARQRLQLLGMPDGLIRKVERTAQPHTIVTITSPIDGMVQTLEVRTGMSVGMGMTLARIVGIDPVWLEAAVPETQADHVKEGQMLTAQLSAYPSEIFGGRVIAILPEANLETRTLKVRAEFLNPDQRLRPGMYAHVRIEAEKEKPLLWIPTESVIRTGTRNVVIVDKGEGRFLPVEIELGPEIAGKTAISRGLKEGDTIIASGQFLIDSEASLIGVLAKLDTSSEREAASEQHKIPDAELHYAEGTVKSIGSNEIILRHDPISSLGWGAMTMPFTLSNPTLATSLAPGNNVKFTFTADNDEFEIQSIEKVGDAP